MTADFLKLLEKLIKADVDFVIVGGFAGVAHGCTFVTQDIDICCDFSADNLLRLQKALHGLHPVHRMATNRQQLQLNKENCNKFKNLYLDTDIAPLDCLDFIDGLGDYENVKKASELIETEGIRLRVLSIDGLIAAKQAMNRPRDKEIILQLETIKKLQNRKDK